MAEFSATETNENFNSVTVGYKSFCVTNLGLKIVNVDIKPEFKFFDFDNLLAFFSFLFAL